MWRRSWILIIILLVVYTCTLTLIALENVQQVFCAAARDWCLLWFFKSILVGARFWFSFYLLCLQKCSGNPCMRKYKPIEFQFDPEIEKTTSRFRKENSNSKVAVAMNNHGEIQPINGQEGCWVLENTYL